MAFSGESVGAIHGTLDLDRTPFTASLDEARRQVAAFEDERHSVLVNLSLDGLEHTKAQLDELHDKTVKIKVDVDKSALAALHGAGGGVNVADGPALAKIEALKREIEGVHGKTVEIKVKTEQSKLAQMSSSLDFLKTKMGALGLAAVTLGPQVLGALGQATLGAGALGVATGGAATAFGTLALAVKDTLSGQGAQAAQLKAIASDETHLAAARKAHNQALIQAYSQQLSAAKASYNAQNALAQHVNDAWGRVKETLQSTLAPAVQQVLGGMSTMLHTIGTSIGGLQGPFLVLGTAVKNALSSPATQAGIRSLITGFGQIVKASAPLAGPIIKGMIDVGKILENIAKAAMPVLVSGAKDVVAWLGKLANTSGTPKFAAEIQKWGREFGTVVKDIGGIVKALAPLFASASGFQPLIGAVTSIVSGFTHFLNKLGPIGRLLSGGLGIALIATKFNPLASVLKAIGWTLGKTLLPGLTKLGGAAIVGIASKLPGLLPLLWGVDGAFGAMAAATWAAIAPFLPFIAGVALVVGAIVALIHWHKQVWAAIKWTWNAIKDAVVWAVNAVVDAVKAGFKFMENIVEDVGKAIGKAVSAAWDFVKKAIGDALKSIGHIVEDGWKAVEGLFTKAWDALGNVVRKGVDAVVNFVKGLPGRVLSGLGNIAKTLWNAGIHLIEGFVNGALSVIKDVVGLGGKIVSSIGSAVTGLLGIGSPSKVAHTWGQAVGQGLITGMLSQHSAVAAAAKALAGAAILGAGSVRPGLNLSVSGGGGAALAGAGTSGGLGPPSIVVNQHFHSLVPGTPAQLRQISGAVTEAQRRTTPNRGPRRA